MLKALCRVAKAPLRAEASDRSEMVSELLFGEEVKLLERKDNWARVMCDWDGYEGWVDFIQLIEKLSSNRETTKVQLPILDCLLDGEIIRLPLGSKLQKLDGKYLFEQLTIELNEYIPITFENPAEKLIHTAKLFLNTPYLWGGRSCFGIDCSGLVQVCHSLINIPLKRDASEQYLQGEKVERVEDVLPGDLAFFKNKKGKISHVGILCSNNQIIHASSWVRIDRFDEKGIYNEERKTYSHELAGVRRNIV